MRVVKSKHPLPRRVRRLFPEGYVVCSVDIALDQTRLCKVILFRTLPALRKGYPLLCDALGYRSRVSRTCWGWCVIGWDEESKGPAEAPTAERMIVDPRYSAVIGLSLTKLTTEIVCHEAVHAGMAHARIKNAHPRFDVHQMKLEEDVAYPAGYIAAETLKALRNEGFTIK